MGNDQLLDFLRRIGFPEVPTNTKGIIYRGACMLHGGDNENALLVYRDGYACMTKGCHKDKRFGTNLIGLVRSLVFRLTGEALPWGAAWQVARENKSKLRALVEQCNVRRARRRSTTAVAFGEAELLDCLAVPARMFIRRGYTPETLARFGVGTCNRIPPDGNDLIDWAVFPVRDIKGVFTGYTARSPWTSGPKWFHAMVRNDNVFNIEAASKTAAPIILCEGPPCAMRFFEAGYGAAVATFGANLSPVQYEMLTSLMRGRVVVIAGDNDQKGRAFADEVAERLRSVCEPRIIFPPKGKDFGDNSTEDVRQWMAEYLGEPVGRAA